MRTNSPFSVGVGIGSQQLLVASPKRKRVSFTPPAQGRVTITTNPPAILDQGDTLVAGQAPRVFEDGDEGGAASKQWFAISDSNAPLRFVGIAEVMMP